MVLIPTLETDRLRLRPYALSDFETYAAMWSEPEVVRFIGGVPFSREVAWTRFLRQVGMWQSLGFGAFAIEEKASGRFAGECGFHDLRRALTPSLEGTMETGWALTAPFQGKGMAEEATRAAVEWAGKQHRDKRLTCMIVEEHAASLHVAGKLGYAEFARTTYANGHVVLLERPRR